MFTQLPNPNRETRVLKLVFRTIPGLKLRLKGTMKEKLKGGIG